MKTAAQMALHDISQHYHSEEILDREYLTFYSVRNKVISERWFISQADLNTKKNRALNALLGLRGVNMLRNQNGIKKHNKSK